MKKTRISVIEDNKVIRDNVAKFISFHEEFEVAAIHGRKSLMCWGLLTTTHDNGFRVELTIT